MITPMEFPELESARELITDCCTNLRASHRQEEKIPSCIGRNIELKAIHVVGLRLKAIACMTVRRLKSV